MIRSLFDCFDFGMNGCDQAVVIVVDEFGYVALWIGDKTLVAIIIVFIRS